MGGKPKDQYELMTTVMLQQCREIVPTSFNHKYNMLKMILFVVCGYCLLEAALNKDQELNK